MSNSKRNKIATLIALVLCLALAAIFVFAFAACDDAEASAADEIEEEGEKEAYRATVNTFQSTFVANSEPDENGVTSVTYYYERCEICYSDSCGGHSMYMSEGGGFYDFYPYVYPMTMTDENGEICSEIQVSLVFEEEPVIYEDGEYIYFQGLPYIEIASLTGDALWDGTVVAGPQTYDTFKLTQGVMYHVVSTGNIHKTIIDEEHVVDIGIVQKTSTETTVIYSIPSFYGDGYYVFNYTDSDGVAFDFGFYAIANSVIWDAVVNGNGNIDWRPTD